METRKPRRKVANKEKHLKLSKSRRFFVLLLASLFYSYGIGSLAIVFAMIGIVLIRRDLNGFQEITLENLLLIIIGVIVFFPARKIRKDILDGPK